MCDDTWLMCIPKHKQFKTEQTSHLIIYAIAQLLRLIVTKNKFEKTEYSCRLNDGDLDAHKELYTKKHKGRLTD